MRLKRLYIKIHNKREKIENFVADNILKKIDESKKIDNLEKILVSVSIDVIEHYLETYKVTSLTKKQKENISTAIVKGLSKVNKKLQKQLKKGKLWQMT
ncbi:MAG: hypothetical protein ACI4SM_05060 [Candidatus Gastranaerophilaceae bacterium]